MWSNGLGAAALGAPLASFEVDEEAGRAWVSRIAWDPHRASAAEVWRTVFRLAGAKAGRPAR